MAMEAKDLRTESTLSERSNDGKYGQSGTSIQCTKSKTYQDIGSSPSSKVDLPVARPCAVIGPDRVVPPPASDEYLKKASVEPWPFLNNGYRRPPEYPNKLCDYQNQARNISPRQTYQENMQRIMVPPTYSSIKVNEDYNQMLDRSGSKHSIKLNATSDNKYCDVPYIINNTANDQKSTRNPDMCVSNVNPQFSQTPPQGWPSGYVGVRPPRGYGAPEVYQYPEYSSCAGPRPAPIARPLRTAQDDPGLVYPEPYYQDANIRFKPYPNIKDRYTPARYEYIGNYSNPFYPAPVPPHKYDIHKSIPSHPYSTYAPLKSIEGRMGESIMDGYHRAVPPGNYNIPFRNPVIHPSYGSFIPNCPQGKIPYLSENTSKIPASNKPPHDSNGNVYVEHETSRLKTYSTSENVYSNEIRAHAVNNQIVMPNYSSLNLHSVPPYPYYKKESLPLKSYEYINNLKNMDPMLNVINPIPRHLPNFSPNSPTNSSASNDTILTHSTLHEDCGYVSQSSGTSVKSIDSGIYRNSEYYRRFYDSRYRPLVRASPITPKHENQNSTLNSKDKKQINVRQFLQMWNEGDDENEENNTSKEVLVKPTAESNVLPKLHDSGNTQEQLYVLGLVNVPSEELSKYEHIQTVSKLPENIKGYNSIELLNQFEEVVESTNMSYYKPNISKQNKLPLPNKHNILRQTPIPFSRPLSPLDVEAKISQSVIHKEVGCNFEIKPCSPKMLNVELATPVQNILEERAIEKVSNPLSSIVTSKSPMFTLDNNIDTCKILKNTNHVLLGGEHIKTHSCKMANGQYLNSVESPKTNYSLHDLESNSGVCLASLPRLDNDIELNFPEVNQQFINANKSEAVNVESVVHDLPQLVVTDRGQVIESKDTEYTVQNIADQEKHVSKLSKFRKNKNNGLEFTDDTIQSKIIRTDSVIIKNPENVKNLEENIENIPINRVFSENQLSPMNLISHCDKMEGTQEGKIESDAENVVYTIYNDSNNCSENAIDFSFNKNDNTSNFEMDKDTVDDILARKNVIPQNKNCENSALMMDKNPDESVQSEVCEGTENTCTNLGETHGTVNPLNIVENQEFQNHFIEGNITENLVIAKEDRKTMTQDIAPLYESLPKEVELIPEKWNLPNGENETSMTETLNLKQEFSEIIHGPDNFNSHHKVLQNTYNGGGDETHKCNCDNSEIKNLDNGIEKNTEKTEANHALVEYSEGTLNSELVETTTRECTESFVNIKHVNEDGISEKSNIKTPIPEAENVQVGDNIKMCDEIKSKELILDSITSQLSTDSEVLCKQGTLSKNNLKHNSIESLNTNDSDITHKIPEIPNNINDEQKSLSKVLDPSSNEDKYKIFKETTASIVPNDMVPIVPHLESVQKNTFEQQPIETRDEAYECTDIKESSGAIKIPIDSGVLKSYQEMKSTEQQIIMKDLCDQPTNNEKHLNQHENNQNCNVLKEVPVLDELIPNGNYEIRAVNGINDNINVKTPTESDIDNLINTKDIENMSLNNSDSNNFTKEIVLLKRDDRISEEISKDLFPDQGNNISDINDSDLNTFSTVNDTLNPTLNAIELPDSVVNDETQHNEVPESDGFISENILNGRSSNQKDVLLDVTANDLSENTENNDMLQKHFLENEIIENKVADKSNSQMKGSILLKSSSNSDTDDMSFKENSCPMNNINNSHIYTTHSEIKASNKNDNPDQSQHKHIGQRLFRKNLYSPYVQYLVTFSEGKCNGYNEEFKPLLQDSIKNNDLAENRSSLFKIKNSGVEIKIPNGSEKNIVKIDGTESARLVDYDSSDYSLSPYAPSELQVCSKLEENIDLMEKLQENQEINKIQLTPIIESTIVDDKNCITYKNTNEKNTLIDFRNEEVMDDNSKLIDTLECKGLDPTKEILEENEPSVGNNETNSGICLLGEFSRRCLKRSLSDSALNKLNVDMKETSDDNIPYAWSFKRKKINDNLTNNNVVAADLCNVINSNRRNSISSIYTEENVSFCILIDDNCIITEEDNNSKVCYTEIPENLFENISNNSIIHTDSIVEIIPSQDQEDGICEYSDSYAMECDQDNSGDKSPEATWVDDVAEDIVISSNSPDYISDYEESENFGLNSNEHTDKVKHIYGDKLCLNDAKFVETLYNTPQMDVNKTLIHRESHDIVDVDNYYDIESLQKVLSDPNDQEASPASRNNCGLLSHPSSPSKSDYYMSPQHSHRCGNPINHQERVQDSETNIKLDRMEQQTQDDTVHSCESSIDDVFSYSQRDESNERLTSSSPEVSSTTSEEKSSSILLKITNFKGSIVSQISEYNSEIINKMASFKNTNNTFDSGDKIHSKKPLITKAAQKYIPPLKETIHDLKVKISLPQDSLKKLKQMKITKEELKRTPHNPNIPKKSKPKFEDVLKSIDEIQFKMHKEKSKKPKKSIPKVVIKKNLNGSHYASTKNKETYNPDLTGRKWQPWVFIEKNSFIDKMAIKKQTKAIFSHRKNTFVLAEKFYKYKSVNSTTFFITQPTYTKPSSGQLKYTIKLKHSY